MDSQQLKFTVILQAVEGGGFTATCPALLGVVTEGRTLEEARSMAKDAIEGYLRLLRRDGLPFPSDVKVSLVELAVEVPST